MVEPVSLTGAALVALAASKFVEKSAEKLGEGVTPAVLQKAGKQVDALWLRVKQHFVGNGKAERAIAQIEGSQIEGGQIEGQIKAGQAEALSKLAVYLDDDLQEPQNQALANELRQMAQQIINIGQQQQTATTFNIEARDKATVNAVGEINHATTVNIGNGPS
jgi:hypothetical protein